MYITGFNTKPCVEGQKSLQIAEDDKNNGKTPNEPEFTQDPLRKPHNGQNFYKNKNMYHTKGRSGFQRITLQKIIYIKYASYMQDQPHQELTQKHFLYPKHEES